MERAATPALLCAGCCCCAHLTAWASEHHGQVFFGGVPVPGATVTVTQGKHELTTVTDHRGCTIPDLADGAWKIQIEMRGFATLEGE